jgi:hypothetical protein
MGVGWSALPVDAVLSAQTTSNSKHCFAVCMLLLLAIASLIVLSQQLAAGELRKIVMQTSATDNERTSTDKIWNKANLFNRNLCYMTQSQ